MENIVSDSPNLNVETVPVKEASVGLDAIAAKMAAMRNASPRNPQAATEDTGTKGTHADGGDWHVLWPSSLWVLVS